ncbi:hypothetical protein PSMK_04550 [Phycisphaera mikurensis NBRC 102666]|uniref:Uncharacterized protein n=1 Tax=Phycisphaera mikurensis (strain NBRC 102666 / KCTC 22515 / FYK2301M01) TaxID=1142394 RepID=I0IBH6_PHYMF|nr:hypothetical protein PSMK_04550 [Phycisphaera mikurensis NBRC 102666]
MDEPPAHRWLIDSVDVEADRNRGSPRPRPGGVPASRRPRAPQTHIHGVDEPPAHRWLIDSVDVEADCNRSSPRPRPGGFPASRPPKPLSRHIHGVDEPPATGASSTPSM